MDKPAILQLVIRNLEEEIARNEQSYKSVRQGAIEAPGTMQSKSDTTKSELSQVAIPATTLG